MIRFLALLVIVLIGLVGALIGLLSKKENFSIAGFAIAIICAVMFVACYYGIH